MVFKLIGRPHASAVQLEDPLNLTEEEREGQPPDTDIGGGASLTSQLASGSQELIKSELPLPSGE